MNRLTHLFLLGLLVFSFWELTSSEAQHNEDEHDADDDFKREFGDEEPTHSMGTEDEHFEVREQSEFVKPQGIQAKDLPPIRFVFCVSCGYKQAFEQFSQFVHDKYPNMKIEWSNYPPVPWKSYLAQFVGIAKIVLIAVVISGSNPFASVGLGYPGVLQWAQGNKISACMMLFLLSNMLEGSLMSTGAFEIFLDEHQLWSKLESGRVPAPGELMQMIDSQLEILGKLPAGAGFSTAFEE